MLASMLMFVLFQGGHQRADVVDLPVTVSDLRDHGLKGERYQDSEYGDHDQDFHESESTRRSGRDERSS